jgi:cell wall-associated NlpC family hydrolase
MTHGISPLSIIPVRVEASSKSEQLTQLLFGELFSVLENEGDWIRIRVQHDTYEGWVEKCRTAALTAEEFETLSAQPATFTNDLMATARCHSNSTQITLPVCSTLRNYNDGAFSFAGQTYTFHGTVTSGSQPITAEILQPYITYYLNAPYLWGGRHPLGIDCSGLVQNIFRLCGIQMPRDACQQAEQGTTVDFVEETQFGDLAFFDNDEGIINHVGILMNNNMIVHAAACVKVGRLDHQGIFDLESQSYSHKLRIIKRIRL